MKDDLRAPRAKAGPGLSSPSAGKEFRPDAVKGRDAQATDVPQTTYFDDG
jgi:hypothetical protein